METVVNEMLRELIEYEWLSVYSFKNKMCRKLGVKIKHYGNNKSNVKKSLKRKEGKYKVVIRLNHQGQETSIKNEWYAIESDTRKNVELKGSLKHTLDIYSITVL